jgi:hypothetical protein
MNPPLFYAFRFIRVRYRTVGVRSTRPYFVAAVIGPVAPRFREAFALPGHGKILTGRTVDASVRGDAIRDSVQAEMKILTGEWEFQVQLLILRPNR